MDTETAHEYFEALYLTGWVQAAAGYPMVETEDSFDTIEEYLAVQMGYDDYLESAR